MQIADSIKGIESPEITNEKKVGAQAQTAYSVCAKKIKIKSHIYSFIVIAISLPTEQQKFFASLSLLTSQYRIYNHNMPVKSRELSSSCKITFATIIVAKYYIWGSFCS